MAIDGGGAACVPYQLSDEMYASILRDPMKHGYPVLSEGSVQSPKYGYIFITLRGPKHRRPKLVDGLDWVPSSTANASTRLLRDGETELLRFYCARRTKAREAKPDVKPFTLFQREHGASIKAEAADGNTTYDHKKLVGEKWRALSAEEQAPYVTQAREHNATSRQRKAAADPSQLLVRHEMKLQLDGTGPEDDDPRLPKAVKDRVLIHYLGGDAFQNLTVPPRPLRVRRPASPIACSSSAASEQHPAVSTVDSATAFEHPAPERPASPVSLSDAIPPDSEASSLQVALGCLCSSVPPPLAPPPLYVRAVSPAASSAPALMQPAPAHPEVDDGIIAAAFELFEGEEDVEGAKDEEELTTLTGVAAEETPAPPQRRATRSSRTAVGAPSARPPARRRTWTPPPAPPPPTVPLLLATTLPDAQLPSPMSADELLLIQAASSPVPEGAGDYMGLEVGFADINEEDEVAWLASFETDAPPPA